MTTLRAQYLARCCPEAFATVPCLNVVQEDSPIRSCGKLSNKLKIRLYCKDDGQLRYPASVKLFGGNKVRKLNFVLAEAMQQDIDVLVTFGGLHSNLTLAAAACASQLGKPVVMALRENPVQPDLSMKLRLGKSYGAHYMIWPHGVSQEDMVPIAAEKFGYKKPYHVPVGALSSLGNLGFVDAALELADQIKRGVMPKPDEIYIGCGSMGSTIGLLIGLQMAGLDTHVTAVRVSDVARVSAIEDMFTGTVNFMRKHGFPVDVIKYNPEQYTLRHDFVGDGYAKALPDYERTRTLFGYSNIKLDPAYSGKVAACLAADAHAGKLKNKTVLFWQTYCSDSFKQETAKITPDQLPVEFQQYVDPSVVSEGA